MEVLHYEKRCYQMDSCRCCRWIRFLSLASLLSLLSLPAKAYDSAYGAHSSIKNPVDRFVAWIEPKLRSVLDESSGIVAERFPLKLAIAQAGLETGWGKHKPAVKRNNFFGLSRNGKHMRFETPEDSIRVYVKSLSGNSAYKDLREKLKVTDHPEALAEELDKYAEDEGYIQKLKSALRLVNLSPETTQETTVPASAHKASAIEPAYERSDSRSQSDTFGLELRFDRSFAI